MDDGEAEEVLIVEQTEELLQANDDNEITDDLMPRSSPDGSAETDNEQRGRFLSNSLTSLLH